MKRAAGAPRGRATSAAASAPIVVTSMIGKRGTLVIPAALRRRFGLTEGRVVIAEEREDGLLIRPAEVTALDERRRQEILEETARDYAALREDPEAWAEIRVEDTLWEETLMDGLDPDEVWTENDFVPQEDPSEHGRSAAR